MSDLNPRPRINVFVVDDHEVVREGVVLALSRTPDLVVVGGAGAAAEALETLPGSQADVAVIDVRMPGMNGLDLCRALRDGGSQIGVLIFTAYSDRSLWREAAAAGADGYLLKDAGNETFARAIREVHAKPKKGELTYIDPALMSSVLASDEVGLTPREREVLEHMADGRSNAEIAAAMGWQGQTVKNYVSRIMRKLQASSRTEAVLEFLREHWSADLR